MSENLEVVKGSVLSKSYILKDGNGAIVNLRGFSVISVINTTLGDRIGAFNTTVVNAENGLINISLPSDNDIQTGLYQYEVDIVSDIERKTVLKGMLNVNTPLFSNLFLHINGLPQSTLAGSGPIALRLTNTGIAKGTPRYSWNQPSVGTLSSLTTSATKYTPPTTVANDVIVNITGTVAKGGLTATATKSIVIRKSM